MIIGLILNDGIGCVVSENPGVRVSVKKGMSGDVCFFD